MRFGFTFPSEHGLIAIWSSTLIFGIIIGVLDGINSASINYWGIIHSFIFSFVIILNYENIKGFVSSKFKEYSIIPMISLFVISIGILVYYFTTYLFIFFAILAGLVALWAIAALKTGKQSYIEMTLGTLAISLQFPIIYGIITPIVNRSHYLYVMAIWWIYTGVILVIVINVGCYRGKIAHHIPLLVWIFYLLTFIPMFVLGYLEPIALLLMIEPSIRGVKQAISKQTMRDMRINIKKLGWNMVIALYTFIILVLVLAITNTTLTKIL